MVNDSVGEREAERRSWEDEGTRAFGRHVRGLPFFAEMGYA